MDSYFFLFVGVIEKLKAQASFAKMSHDRKFISPSRLEQILKVTLRVIRQKFLMASF